MAVSVAPQSPEQDGNDKPKLSVDTSDATVDEPTLSPKTESIGDLAGEYACIYQRANGLLQVGTEGFEFNGYFLFFQQHCFKKWQDVLQVQKTDVGGIIQILDRDDTTVYEFSGIQHVDRVWTSLVKLHNESIRDSPPRTSRNTPSSSVLHSMRTLRRNNSEPLPNTPSQLDLTSPGAAAGDSEPLYMDNAATDDQMNDLRTFFAYTSIKAVAAQSMRRSMGPASSIRAAAPTVEDEEQDWAQLQQEEALPESAVEKHQLRCTLDTFFELFIANDAPHSIPKFMESSEGDGDMVVGSWCRQLDDSFTRTLEYSHPVSAPLAPPMARARKEQRYRKFGNHGMVLETDTYVDDVPMADCFYVTDRILVEAADNPDDDDKVVQVTAAFDIRFVKSTMFRSIIANTTRSEFMNMFKQQVQTMSEALGEEVTKREEVEVEGAVTTPPLTAVTTPSPALLRVLIALIGLVLLMQVWILYQMNDVNQRMLSMQSQVCVSPS